MFTFDRTARAPFLRWPNFWRWTARSSAVAAAFVVGSLSAWAQVPTTVQLPTFQEFSVSTSVLVPDRGGMVLGGVGRSSESSVSRGVPMASKVPGAGRLFGNRAISRDTSASTASAHVWIHDMAELDAATLAAARRAGAAATSPDAEVERKAAFLAKNIGRNGGTATPSSSRSTGVTAASSRASSSQPLAWEPPAWTSTAASARERTSRSPSALRSGTHASRP